MSFTIPKAVTGSPLDAVKMEERKRPALEDGAPPSKRQAVAVNGAHSHPDADMPWKDDIEQYQKDAILRRMKEYKREKQLLEQHITTLTSRSEYHDNHLRIIDAWLLQLVDEVLLLSNSIPPSSSKDQTPFDSSILNANNEKFEEHLKGRSETLRKTLTKLFSNLPVSTSPDIKGLQEKLASLLAAEKVHAAELQQALLDKEQLSERLENASLRYMVAEKKFDRAKSIQVSKMEAQAIHGPKVDKSSTEESDKAETDVKEETIDSSASEAARKEAVAIAEKRLEQLERLTAENTKLSTDLTTAQTRFITLTDEDYANSDLFKAVKSQQEEVVKKVNDLEAANAQLKEEVRSLQTARSSSREEADNEVRAATIEVESQLARMDADLARVRHKRDELAADLEVQKAGSVENKASLQQMKDLVESQTSRITVLESEIERLRGTAATSEAATDVNDLTQLQSRVETLSKEKTLLETELTSMEAAWRRTSSVANKKITDLIDVEDKVARSSAEKAKADQKYFAAMKLKETKDAELRVLKVQNAKSSEIITQLKEAEANCRALLQKVEAQLVESKDALDSLSGQQRTTQAALTEQKLSVERSASQINDLKKALTAKDAAVGSASQAQRQAETEVSRLKAQLADTQKSLEGWKKKGIGNQSQEFESLRKIALCGVCHINFKQTIIKTCGHLTCQTCVDKQIELRSRKCPICFRAFGSNDHMKAIF